VLIHGWREWGLQMQDHLDGMYAFILWDRGTARLAWARDLAGEKPLYEALDPLATSETRIYASTANAAVRFEAMRDATFPRLSPSILGDWVRDGAFMAPPMMIGNAFPGGTHSSDTRPRSQQREGSTKGGVPSTSKVLQEVPPRSSDPAPSNTRETITRAIERAITSRLEADVPLGLFLSGGLDSALIAAIAKQHRPDIKAFTVRMPDPRLDESQAAAETAGPSRPRPHHHRLRPHRRRIHPRR
jgi:asparagine synthase (glutamine-hydrolysing)